MPESEHGPSGVDVGAQIRAVSRMLREQWWIILLCLLATTGAAIAYTATTKKAYEASARLLIHEDNVPSAITGTAAGGVDPTRQAATDAQLAALPAVAARVTARLRRPLSSAAVSTSASPDTNLLTVTVRDPDASSAALFANAFAREYIAFRRDTTRARFAAALNVVQRRIATTRKGTPDANTLASQAKQLRLALSLQAGDAQVIQAAVPPGSPVAPRPVRNVLLGLLIGLLLGLTLATLRDRLDRRIKRETELESLAPNIPIIALIPRVTGGEASRKMSAEAYYGLETGLRLITQQRGPQSVLVTSAMPGEGKSTVAINLALATREHGRSVLLIDSDLRRPAISNVLAAARKVGVSSVLAGDSTLSDSTQEVDAEVSLNGHGPAVALSGKLPLVSAGPATTTPQILLTEPALMRMLEASRTHADTVVFDGAPIGAFSDMLPLGREVSAVILVVRLGHSRSDQLKRFLAQLETASILPVGMVVVGVRDESPQYYLDYYGED